MPDPFLEISPSMSQPIQKDLPKPLELPKIKIDIQSIKRRAVESHHQMAEMEISPTPYMKLIQEVAHSKSSVAPLFQTIVDNSSQMADILPLEWTGLTAIEEMPESREWLQLVRSQDLQHCSDTLREIGITLTPNELESTPRDTIFEEITSKYRGLVGKEGLAGVIASLQSEFFGILHATRSLEETRLIFEKVAPHIAWPKKAIIATTLYDDAIGEINGYYGLKSGGQHIVMLREPGEEANNYQREAREPELIMIGKKASMMVIAAHEGLGHAGFSELFPEQDAIEVFEIGRESARRDGPRLLDSGYAMYIEDIAIEAAKNPQICADSRDVVESVEDFQKRRASHLEQQKGHPIARIYPDGKTLINKLLQQLGIEQLPKEHQLPILKAKLSSLDIISMAHTKPEEDIYLKCLQDPLGNLPIKKTS